MAEITLVMPQMGESIMEGTILDWVKQPGDAVEADETVLEVATDKVDTEVPAPQAGRLKTILVKKGTTVSVGTPIAILEGVQDGEGTKDDTKATKGAEAPKEQVQIAQKRDFLPEKASKNEQKGRFLSPLVRKIAHTEGLNQEALNSITGTGHQKRVTKQDILSYLERKRALFTPSADGEMDEVIKMDRMRSLIAERMVESKRISPHVTSCVEADVTDLIKWQSKIKQGFYDETGAPITLMPLFIEATVKAIQDFPMINISISGSNIIRHKAINIGIAIALPTGNLIVPVLHHADKLTLREIALKANDLARRARGGKLRPQDITGGTYTVSNLGTFRNIIGTPIIVQPQCAILAFGAARKQVAVITDEEKQDLIAIRQKMFLSHSYDHRGIDGLLGGSFVKRVAEYLEEKRVGTSV